MTGECHVDDPAKDRYNIILGRDIFTSFGLHLQFSQHAIKGGDRPSKGSTAPMIDLVTYEFKDLIQEVIFINEYTEKVFELEHFGTSTK